MSTQETHPAVEVSVNGHRLKLAGPDVSALKKLGISTDWVTNLLKAVGPAVAQIIIQYLLTRSARLGGVLDDINVDALRHLLAGLLRSYKETLGHKADEWVEEGIAALADKIDGGDAPPSVP